MAIEKLAFRAGNRKRLFVDVLRTTQTVADHAGRHCCMGKTVDQDKTAQYLGLVIGIECQRFAGGDIALGDIVEAELFAGLVCKRINVDAILDLRIDADARCVASLMS